MVIVLENEARAVMVDGKPVATVRVAWVECACKKLNPIFVTEGAAFSFYVNGHIQNVWNYRTKGDRITIFPSIGLNAVSGHMPECHLQITDEPFMIQRTPVAAG